jgi:hypothetical protein
MHHAALPGRIGIHFAQSLDQTEAFVAENLARQMLRQLRDENKAKPALASALGDSRYW